MQKVRKPLSILLSLIMVFSVFTIVPFTAQATTANVWCYDRYWNNSVQKVLTEIIHRDAQLL